MKISICMCTYNGEKFIREQLNSILAQTICPNEIIIFDDCSTDDTVKVIRDFINTTSSIDWKLFINKSNEGWKMNFHSAINEATGDYIFLSDQDDIWELTKVANMIETMNDNPNIDVLTCNQVIWYEESSKFVRKFKNDFSLEKIVDCKYLLFTARPGCVYCIKKDFIKEFNKFWDPAFPHDSLLWKLAYLKGTLYNLNFYGIKWRRHNDNATGKTKRIISYENVNTHYQIILLYISIMNKIKNWERITEKNELYLQDAVNMLTIRRNLYENRKVTDYLKLIRYIKFYASNKAFLLDGLVFFIR